MSETTEATAIAEITQKATKPELMNIRALEGDPEVQVLVTKDTQGYIRVEDLSVHTERYLNKPRRRKGIARFTALDSLIAHTQRFQSPDSAVFLDENQSPPTVTTVLNYHPKDQNTTEEAAFCDHQGVCVMRFSEEWNAWQKVHEETVGLFDFGKNIEQLIIDVVEPTETLHRLKAADELSNIDSILLRMIELENGVLGTPFELKDLAKGISINSTQESGHHISNVDGASKLHIETVIKGTKNSAGKDIVIPSLFLIKIPVFKHDAPYIIPVRLFHGSEEGKSKFRFELLRAELFLDDASMEAGMQVAAATELPLMLGTPEGTRQRPR